MKITPKRGALPDFLAKSTQTGAAAAILLSTQNISWLSPVATLAAFAIIFGPQALFWISQSGARRIVRALRNSPDDVERLQLLFRAHPDPEQLNHQLKDWLSDADRVDAEVVKPLLQALAMELAEPNDYIVRDIRRVLMRLDAKLLEDLRWTVGFALTCKSDERGRVAVFDRLDENSTTEWSLLGHQPSGHKYPPPTQVRLVNSKRLFRLLKEAGLGADPRIQYMSDRLGDNIDRSEGPQHAFDVQLQEMTIHRLREIVGPPIRDV